MPQKHNRAVSLPLQRFIDERMDMNYENDAGVDADSSGAGRRPSSVASHLEHQEPPKDPVETNSIQRLASRRIEHAHETKPSSSRPKSRVSEPGDRMKRPSLRNVAERSLNPQPASSARLSKGLHAHRSVDNLRTPRQDSRPSRAKTPVENLRKNGSGSSTPSRGAKQTRDHLDEKISTILDALPTRIQLVSQDDSDASSVTSSIAPLKTRERFRSVSPGAVSTRTTTSFAPSMTLTPAMSRRRQSSSHGPEESSVKLYHLHKGGKTNPTKLFVRTVGENGERVMVRVGGGWADLGEYLREYAIHHGRRHVSDTPRVEVRGIPSSSRDSPSSNSMLTPTPTHAPGSDRPRSVLSNRPSSSLGVRKTRRTSNVSETGADNIRAVSMGDSPLSSSASRRRLSASSNNSFGATSLASEAHQASSVYSPSTTIAAGGSISTPLGLAGPKPRSRHVSMSPESEAWVEDVLGQARRSSLRPAPGDHVDGHGQSQGTPPGPRPRVVTKVRSVGDMSMRSVSDMASRRVALRGLGNRVRG